jgi:hypothetical protein
MPLEGARFRVSYDFAPEVGQVQGFLTSDEDRSLNSDPLARHFLPAYTYITLNYVGGNSSRVVAQAVYDYVNGLASTDNLDLSQIETVVLSRNNVVRYDHPIELVVVVHDMDRRLVCVRSTNRISDDEIAYNGTNRTTFFIPGPVVTGVASAPTGERTRADRRSS